MRVLSLIVLVLLVVGLTVLVGRGVRRGWRKHGRYRTRRVFVVLGVLFYLYWVIPPVVVAIVATSGSGNAAVLTYPSREWTEAESKMLANQGFASEPEEFTKRVTDFYNEHLDADPSRPTD